MQKNSQIIERAPFKQAVTYCYIIMLREIGFVRPNRIHDPTSLKKRATPSTGIHHHTNPQQPF
jgi:hypothetical protein